MPSFWIHFSRHRAACVEAEDFRDAEQLAFSLTGERPIKMDTLPYPANPRLNQVIGLSGSPTPTFCYAPDRCAGCSSCPRDPACSS
jgi:hypothetical protein